MSLTEIRDLERKAFKAWPALETQANFGWVQRFAGGYTKRANSINAIEAKPDFTPAAMADLERPYRERGQPPIWRLTPLAPAGPDGVLADRGYRRGDQNPGGRAAAHRRVLPRPAGGGVAAAAPRMAGGVARTGPRGAPRPA